MRWRRHAEVQQMAPISATAADRDELPVFQPLREVEAGCVLVASPDEIDHFSRHAVVLVLSHGAQGSRGVTLEMATAFNLGEMAASLSDSPFSDLPLFRGGSSGKDQILMLHDVAGLAGSQPIGTHGIHVGGLQSARDAAAQGLILPERFKFFFNQYEWVPGALQREVSSGIWTVGTIPSELVLRQVGSQSERPLGIDRKVGHVASLGLDMSKSLWDILRDNMPASLPEDTAAAPAAQMSCGAESVDHPDPPHAAAEQLGSSSEGDSMAHAHLARLPRRELQALAKEYGIKANIKSQDIINKLVIQGYSPGSSAPTPEIGAPAKGAGMAGGTRDAAEAEGQRAVFLQMMVERVWEFRRAVDAEALLPLLDAGAEVMECVC